MANWTLLGRPSGHSFFQNERGKISICDQSGENPDETDDGPLFLNPSRPARLMGHGVTHLPVRDRNNKECFAFCIEKDFEWLCRNGYWKRMNREYL